MPELPEVETIARALRPALVGAEILGAEVLWARTVAVPSARKFREQIRGQKILSVGRRAKFFNLQLSTLRETQGRPFNLLVHLRMSGDLFIKGENDPPEKHDRLRFMLSNGTTLGPEPLSDEFTSQWLYENLRKRHRQLKPLLLDQAFLAGLGNIYTDEALHAARLHPQAASDSVKQEQAERLHEAIRAVLEEGIRRNGASIDWVYRGGEFQNYFRVYDREGKPCLVCGTKIMRLVVGQRGTHVCPKCQKTR
jgi:formamidopyrimidine-DNA glycosylase